MAVHSGSSARPHHGRPFRRVRRWARHTPNGEIAVVLLALGVLLIFVAAVCALLLL